MCFHFVMGMLALLLVLLAVCFLECMLIAGCDCQLSAVIFVRLKVLPPLQRCAAHVAKTWREAMTGAQILADRRLLACQWECDLAVSNLLADAR